MNRKREELMNILRDVLEDTMMYMLHDVLEGTMAPAANFPITTDTEGRVNQLKGLISSLISTQREESAKMEHTVGDLLDQKEGLVEALSSVNREKKALMESLTEAKALIASLETEKGELASKLESTASERDAAVSQAANLEFDNSRMERALASLQEEKDELVQAFERLKQETNAVEDSNAGKRGGGVPRLP